MGALLRAQVSESCFAQWNSHRTYCTSVRQSPTLFILILLIKSTQNLLQMSIRAQELSRPIVVGGSTEKPLQLSQSERRSSPQSQGLYRLLRLIKSKQDPLYICPPETSSIQSEFNQKINTECITNVRQCPAALKTDFIKSIHREAIPA